MDPTVGSHAAERAAPCGLPGARHHEAHHLLQVQLTGHAPAGRDAGMAMPFRGQSAPVVPTAEELAALPQGPCRAVALRSRMMRSVTTFAQPQPHASLGLPAYLQFTSPIRRYVDLLSHYQMKVRSKPWTRSPEHMGGGLACGGSHGHPCRMRDCPPRHHPGCSAWPPVPCWRTFSVSVWLGGG